MRSSRVRSLQELLAKALARARAGGLPEAWRLLAQAESLVGRWPHGRWRDGWECECLLIRTGIHEAGGAFGEALATLDRVEDLWRPAIPGAIDAHRALLLARRGDMQGATAAAEVALRAVREQDAAEAGDELMAAGRQGVLMVVGAIRRRTGMMEESADLLVEAVAYEGHFSSTRPGRIVTPDVTIAVRALRLPDLSPPNPRSCRADGRC